MLNWQSKYSKALLHLLYIYSDRWNFFVFRTSFGFKVEVHPTSPTRRLNYLLITRFFLFNSVSSPYESVSRNRKSTLSTVQSSFIIEPTWSLLMCLLLSVHTILNIFCEYYCFLIFRHSCMRMIIIQFFVRSSSL